MVFLHFDGYISMCRFFKSFFFGTFLLTKIELYYYMTACLPAKKIPEKHIISSIINKTLPAFLLHSTLKMTISRIFRRNSGTDLFTPQNQLPSYRPLSVQNKVLKMSSLVSIRGKVDIALFSDFNRYLLSR